MSPRLRPVSYVIQPQFMVDDGETLVPLPVQPLTISATDWPGVVEMVAGAVEQLRGQVEGPPLTAVVDETRSDGSGAA